MTQFIQLVFEYKFPKDNYVTKLLLLILLLCTTPLYAETNYLYASDINDNTRQGIYNAKRANYYTIQRNEAYPNNIMTDVQLKNQKYFYPERKNYNTIDRQVDEISAHVPYNSLNRIPPDYQYPVKDYVDRLGNHVFKQSIGIDRIIMPTKMDEQYKQMHPNLLYVSDLIPSRHSIKQKSKTMRYEFQNQPGYPNTRDPIRYIPAPIYSVPGMLPGNIPGIMTQRNLIPGYNHFRPNYNYGDLNNIPGTPYHSISRGK